jgi:hypothetical protein
MNALSGTSGPGGWRTPTVVLVCASAILFLALGTRQGFGLFLQPMCSALGWGRETFSAAIALQNLMWGLAQPFVGAIADRFGAGRVLVVGGLCYATGLVLMAHSNTGLELGLSTGLLIGIGLSACSFGVVLGVVGRRAPPARRTIALASRAPEVRSAVRDAAVLPTLISQFGWFNARSCRRPAFLIVPCRRARGPDDPSPCGRAGHRAGAAGGREPQGVLAPHG